VEEIKAEIKESISEKEIKKRKDKIIKFFFGWIKDNYDKVFLAILIAAFILRIWVFLKTMNQPLWWDEADYIATAKRWAGLNPYLVDMWYYRRGFIWPLIETIFFKTGIGEVGIRFLVSLLSTGVVFVSYFLVQKMFNKKLAVLTSLGITLSWVYLFFTGRLLTELPSTFFLLLFLLFFWKGYVLKEGDKFLYISGIFCALAVLTRMQTMMFLPAVLLFILIKEKHKVFVNKKLWTTLLIFFLILTPFFFIYWQHFGNPLADLSKYYLGVGNSQKGEVGVRLNQFSDLFLYYNNLPYILNGDNGNFYENNSFQITSLNPITILFLIGAILFLFDFFIRIDKIFKDEETQKRAFILLWIITSLLFLGYMAPQLEQRYIIPALPFLFIVAFLPLLKVENYISKKFKMKENHAFAIIFIAITLLLIPGFLFANNLIDFKLNSYSEIKQTGEWIKENSNPQDIVISNSLPQIAAYSERSTYPYDLAYRRDLTHGNESTFIEFVKTEKPRFLMISAFESQEDWIQGYLVKNQASLTPVKVLSQNNQPVVIVYEFKYS
jgi:4-amino-4-deoxy-L-arabinose transferase-like glycosyltransferase